MPTRHGLLHPIPPRLLYVKRIVLGFGESMWPWQEGRACVDPRGLPGAFSTACDAARMRSGRPRWRGCSGRPSRPCGTPDLRTSSAQNPQASRRPRSIPITRARGFWARLLRATNDHLVDSYVVVCLLPNVGGRSTPLQRHQLDLTAARPLRPRLAVAARRSRRGAGCVPRDTATTGKPYDGSP